MPLKAIYIYHSSDLDPINVQLYPLWLKDLHTHLRKHFHSRFLIK